MNRTLNCVRARALLFLCLGKKTNLRKPQIVGDLPLVLENTFIFESEWEDNNGGCGALLLSS